MRMCEPTRRDFVIQASAAAVALLFASCAGSATSPITLSGSFTVKLSDYPALANVGGVALVTSSGGYPVVLERTASGYLALSRVCPHQGGTIGLSGSTFVCPVHGARFDMNGTWTGGERTSNMRQLSVTADASGVLTIA
jgi:Rieske Fe-S protein